MSYNNEQSKSSRFDRLMYSDPEHVVFSYSPQARHMRLLEMEKWVKNYENNVQADYFQQSFHLRDMNNAQNNENFTFIPKRCMMLDNQLTVIEKKQQGEPLNYHKTYNKHINEQLSKKIFYWYSDHQQMFVNSNSQFFKQYFCYQQINSFCFGRKHFVRSLNSIQLSSDHISRNHCQLMIKKGKTKDDMQRYLELLFGINLNKKNKIQNKEKIKNKLSQANQILKITKQLWSIIYSFIFLSQDKYYLVDNGSRNGTFFIQCFNTQKVQQIQQTNQYDFYGQKIIQNHKLSIKQGYSYEFQGQEYLMKVWRLTETKSVPKITKKSQFIKEIQTFKPKINNQKTIKYIQQFEEKINWFNNFQKVNKDYIIDQNLLKRNLWKGKKFYQQMKNKELNKKQNISSYSVEQNYERIEQTQFQNIQRINESNQLSLIPQNSGSQQNQNISKTQFIKLIYQQFLFQQKILQKNNISSIELLKPQLKYEQNSIEKNIPHQDINVLKKLFINEHQINTLVMSLDFSNDFKKLYCIITQTNKQNKFHLGSQMIINTARFQFQQNQKCNGYIQFDGSKWNIVALASKSQTQQKKTKSTQNIDFNDNLSGSESDLQQFLVFDKSYKQSHVIHSQNKFAKKAVKTQQSQNLQQKKYYKMNLSKKLSNKIWTKIPATSLYELNPQKCQNYLIRLAHSFYFQLKFLNFTNQQTNELNFFNGD